MTPRHDSMRSRVLQAIRKAGSGSPAEIAKLVPGCTPRRVGGYLCSLAEYGLIYPARTAHKTTRYFADKAEAQAHLDAHGGPYVPPELRGNTAASNTKPLRHAAARLDPGAVVEDRGGVKVTVGRPYTHDPRYQLPPGTTRLPPGMHGAGFVADWNHRRRSTQVGA
jgi:hypothetical protein